MDPTITENDTPMTSAQIVDEIRKKMSSDVVGVPIQAYIIPSIDAHQNEFVSIHDNRIRYVSGFTGSVAEAVIIDKEIAAFWTDSRYYLQAENQLDNETWTLMKSGMPDVPKIEDWLLSILPANSRVGIDPFLIEASRFQKLNEKLSVNGNKLISITTNLVDLVWTNRPKQVLGELQTIGKKFSGKQAFEKLREVRDKIREQKAESHIVTMLDDIAWLFNLRGRDIESTPVFYSYAIITQNELYLYLLNADERYTDAIDNFFFMEKILVIVKEYNGTRAGINEMIRLTKGKVLLSKASEAIQYVVPDERRIQGESPIASLKVIKNDVEANGMRQAHIRDGAALVKYFYWLETEINNHYIDEITGANELHRFRSENERFHGNSFPTISAFGSHAALPHYTATPETAAQITRKEIYLVDSGGQYLDGTTDITRTVHFGTPTDREINAFTRVFKGFVSVATAIFPPNAPFSFFDAMARRSLWDVGLNYNHGTGHGVGAFLNVHEYPPLISSRNSGHGMMKNMFTSNEPGYYEEDSFGIRIEDVIQVVELPNSSHYFEDKGAFCFHDITMAPIQTKLLNVELLTEKEIEWLNEYHKQVRENVSPLLGNNSNAIDWLFNQTKPISREKPPAVKRIANTEAQNQVSEQSSIENNPPDNTDKQ